MDKMHASHRMGMQNQTFMKAAAIATWLGDFMTAWMVTDMMLQVNESSLTGRGEWDQRNFLSFVRKPVMYKLEPRLSHCMSGPHYRWLGEKIEKAVLFSFSVHSFDHCTCVL